MSDLNSTTNLIINNIPWSVTEEQLTRLFMKFGVVKSCKLMRLSERDERTFGFCEFEEARSAKSALENLDGFRLKERSLKVAYAKVFPKPRGKSIDVRNLPKSTLEDTVKKYFSQFGRISRLRLLTNESSNSQTKTAEIVFENKGDADKAAQKSPIKWNYDSCKQVNVDIILVTSERSYLTRDHRVQQSQSANLINSQQTQLGDNYFYIQQRSQTAFNQNPYDLSHLSDIVSYGSLGSIYQNAIQLSSLTNGVGGGSAIYPGQNYANMTLPMVHYPTIEQNDKTMQHSLNTFSGGATVPYSIFYPSYGAFINTNNSLSVGIPLVYTSSPVVNNQHCKNIAIDSGLTDHKKSDWYNKPIPKNNYVVYVYNIGNSTNGDQLRELFAEKYDQDILRVDVPKDLQNGSNKNFGFITFKSHNSAQLAIDEMNGKDFQGKLLQVSFKK